MILCGEIGAAAGQIPHRIAGAVVAHMHLFHKVSGSQRQHTVTKSHAHQRQFSKERTDHTDLRFVFPGITRTVGEDYSIGSGVQNLLCGSGIGQKHCGAAVLPDESASQIVYSTLTDDYQATLDDHTLYYANFGDYYDYGRLNWLLVIEPNDGSGDCFQIDVITADADAESGIAGDYTGSDVLAPSSFIPGWISGGYRESSWYYTADGTQQAPFRKGEVKITDNGDGTMGVTIDVTDDLKNRITASWSGTAIEVEPEMQSAVYRSNALRRR